MRADRRGFTLLETVIALTILAAIAGIIAVAFRLASVSLERGEEEVRNMARLRAGIGILERTIRSANPAPIPTSDHVSLYFLGEGRKIRFLSTYPASAGKGFRRVSFFEAEGPDDAGMALADASPFRKEMTPWEGTEGARVFLAGVREVAFSYSEGPSGEGTWEWTDTWDAEEKQGLPAAVRVEFSTPSENGPLKTSFVVPVPAGG